MNDEFSFFRCSGVFDRFVLRVDKKELFYGHVIE